MHTQHYIISSLNKNKPETGLLFILIDNDDPISSIQDTAFKRNVSVSDSDSASFQFDVKNFIKIYLTTMISMRKVIPVSTMTCMTITRDTKCLTMSLSVMRFAQQKTCMQIPI